MSLLDTYYFITVYPHLLISAVSTYMKSYEVKLNEYKVVKSKSCIELKGNIHNFPLFFLAGTSLVSRVEFGVDVFHSFIP